MNLRYRVLFADDGFKDRNLQKAIELANLGNDNRGLWDYYATNISNNALDEMRLNHISFLKCISRVADYNAICNVADDAIKSKDNPELLESKIELIHDMSEQFARTYRRENKNLKVSTKEEIKNTIYSLAISK